MIIPPQSIICYDVQLPSMGKVGLERYHQVLEWCWEYRVSMVLKWGSLNENRNRRSIPLLCPDNSNIGTHLLELCSSVPTVYKRL